MTEIDMGNIVPKTPAEKQTQLHQADALSKRLLGETLIRPTHNKPHEINHFIETDIGTINTQFPKRLEIYIALLRLQKTGQDLSAEEKTTLSFWLSTLNNLDTYIENHHLGTRTLKEKQLTAFEKVRDSLERGNTLMTIVLPTGVGKTVLFAEIVEAIAGKTHDDETGKLQEAQLKTLVLVPTVDLVEQTKVRFSQFADTLTLSGKGHQSRLNADVTVMTYQELVAKVKSGKFDFSQYKLVIKDEEHHSVGPETSKAINTLSHAIQLGFTATPVDYEGLNIIHSMSVVEAVEDGLLADFKIRWVKTKFKLPKLNDQGRYDTSELNEKLNTTSRNRSVVQLHRERHLGTSAFAFCFSVDQVKALAAEFNKDGIVAAPVWGKMDEDLKKSLQARQAAGEISEEEAQQLFYENCYNTIRQKFEAGEIEVLCNVKALREGTDIARAKVCYRTAPGMSSVNAAQEAGRVLRLYNDEQAYIYEFIDQEDPNDLPPVSYAEIVGATEVQAHSAVKQSSDNGKEELTELLRELKEATETPQAETENSKPDTVLPATKPTPTIDVPDFEIIVDTQEILHIAQRNKLRREGRMNAEGLHRLDYRALSKEYDLSIGTIMRYVHDLASQYTQSDIIKSGSYYFASDELLELLKERFALSKEYTSITWTDSVSGKLYATRSYFDQRQRKRLDRSGLPFVIRILSGQPAKFYDVEAAHRYFDSIGYTNAIKAASDGFAEISQGEMIEHFGPIGVIAAFLGTDSEVIQGLIDKHKLTGQPGTNRSGRLTTFYSREKLAQYFKEKAESIEIVTDESGMYSDSSGTWASIGALARELPVTRNLISKIVKDKRVPKRTGTVAKVPCELYRLEDVKQILVDRGNISEHITDSNGIYVASDGETYGSIRGLTPLVQASPEASGLSITLDNIKDFIDRYTESYNIAYLQGAIPSSVGNKKAKIYSYSGLLRAMTEQGYFERKRKTSK